MFRNIDMIPQDARYDVIVIGSGAAGMAAALFAAIEGCKVLVVERTEYVGGTSALSAATTWMPNSRHSASVNPDDSREKVRKFLDGVVGNHSPAAMREAFLDSAPEAVAILEANSEVKFRPYATHPDYEQQFEGATMRGRALEPVPFDGRSLGADLGKIRPPIPEFTIFGGMMVDRTDIGHLLAVRKSARSFGHAFKILAHYAGDRLKGRRGSRLVMGNALIGRFLASLNARGVDILLRTEVQDLKTENGAVTGAVFRSGTIVRHVDARRGVVLAAGGFNRHPQRRGELLPQAETHSPSAPGHTGAMQDMALKLGARLGEGNLDNAFWAPVSIRKRADGSTASFPHFVMDRSKPGTVCVDQTGRRFVNESVSYHLFGRAMFEHNKTVPCIPCFIITDAPGLKKYGLGMVRMGTSNLASYLADGYLTEGASVAELARKIGVPASNLETTIAAMNRYAANGVDPEFGRGTTPYHRVNGDASVGPNPTLGPIATAPYYAVRLYPGDIGAATGLVINEWAQVMRADNSPIKGLYACGNEANSIMGGTYPGPGITIGPAITFAYRAVRHALDETQARDAA
ncbi:FAD-dependent oxidoreductase [Bradyrhizobium sp. CB1650]|uniref:FAD-dependent oxidoreductase n=1 Tax=Bradyrhizobium sp. CB1650 TaxID=3039153 RepID=UPI0024359838|nr:FAD-dependent oxidoreductase [Bradyrhizobium sp. CB1650]WGD49415.1 FAD-dependent oxidoreductase [Bradyrhizobium sp. CB1650]